jgi:hypothetical protein
LYWGNTYEYANIQSSSSKLNIQAVFSPELPVQSVKVAFDDHPPHCEKTAPYAVFKEMKGDYYGETIQKGLHKVSATPYARRNCRGSAGTPLVKKFVVNGCYWYNTIYDVNVDNIVHYHFVGDYVTPSLPCEFNMELVALCGFDIDNIRMVLRDEKGKVVHEHTDYHIPYYLFGSHRGKVNAGSIAPGNYTYTPYINGIEHDTMVIAVGNAACT